MLPEFARQFEKHARDIGLEAIAKAPDTGGVLPANLAELYRILGLWYAGGRASLVVERDLFDQLCETEPAPAPVLPPLSSGVVWVDGYPGGIFFAPDLGDPVQRGVLACLDNDPKAPNLLLQHFAWSEGLTGSRGAGMPLVGTWNLFALMADRAVTQAPVNGGHARVIRPGERVKAARRPYTRISLTAPIRPRSTEPTEPTGRHVAAHIRRGHWKRYWVRDPGEKQPIGQKPGKHGPLHEVRTWVRPCLVGEGEPARRQYVVGL